MSGAPPFFRSRSVLVVPGSDEAKVAKALATPSDRVVIDLEDAVAPSSKHRARDLVCELLATVPEAGRIAVRVNPPGTPWCHLDVAALAALRAAPGAIVLPKVEGPEDLAFLDRLLDGTEALSGRVHPLAVHALIETARGLTRLPEIARSSRRLEALVLGYADLAASLGRVAPVGSRLDLWLPAQSALLTAARAAGLQALDGPHLGVHVDHDFQAGVERARDLGFDGKWAIHPRQVVSLNSAFTPAEEEVRQARTVLAALTDAAREHSAGAVALDGQMIDEAVALAARRVLARAAAAL